MPILRIDRLVARHVGPIELLVGTGECICIRGESGAGKTLLLRAIADLDLYQGNIYLDEVVSSSLPPPMWRSAVALAMAESQWWTERIRDHFDHGIDRRWLELLGLPPAAMDWDVARCSTGEKQRLSLLRTLMKSPAVLLLDEPTGNLDESSTRRVEALLEEYRQQRQAALLWVSHDDRQIERVAQRSFVLRDGRLEQQRGRT